jgi:hypothetical protein
LDFEITWCRFKYFNDPAVASEAAQIAAQADLIMVAIQRAQDLPLEVKAWFERWLPDRESTEGALVLLQTSQETPSPKNLQSSYLYLLAQRANLDYLSLSNAAPSSSTAGISDPNGLPKGFPLPIRWGEGQGEGFVRPQHYSHSGINE